MSDQYDVIMIGAGPSAIFCAYELKRNKPDMKVLMIEKGRRIERRACPKRNTKVSQQDLPELEHFLTVNYLYLQM